MTIIEITDEDLRVGRLCSATDCPLAIGIKRKLKPAHKVWVARVFILIGSDDELVACVDTTDAMVRFVNAYDRGEGPYERSFELDIPAECLAVPTPVDGVTA